jgi:hypothetical protein
MLVGRLHAGGFHVCVDILLRFVMGRHLVELASVLVETELAASALLVEVFDCHADHGAECSGRFECSVSPNCSVQRKKSRTARA